MLCSLSSIRDVNLDLDTRSTSLTTANPILDSMSGTSGNFSIMPHATDFTSSAKEARLPCYLISRTRNESFFGRSGVLEVLEEALLPSLPGSSMVDQKNRSLRTFALCGPGGMGKSQTATEFALKHLQRYDAVFWVTADETSKLLEEFSQIAVKIGLVDTGSKDAEDQIVSRDLVKGWLANPIKHLEARESEATWLIIFDNVNDPDILNDFWPVDGTGSILVTSRNPLAKTNVYYAGASGVDLEPFSDDEAAQLLVQLTQKFDDPREVACASAVASRLGGYPLAMAQMAGYISRRHLSFEEFLQRYERDPNLNEIYKNKNSKYRNTYSHNLSTVWALDRLEVGAALLDVLSLLDPDRIDENLLTEGASRCDLEGFPKDEIAYQDARAELLQSSLVSRNLGERRLLIHRIIQDSARARMSPRRLANVFRACIVLVKAVWPFVPLSSIYKVARWTKCEPLFANLVRMKAHFEWIDLKYLDFESKFSFARLMNGAGW